MQDVSFKEIISKDIGGSQNIMVAPLNWGLGHASRCIPIINFLIQQGKNVTIASSGAAHFMLQDAFPHHTVHQLPDYGIRYPFKSMFFNLVRYAFPIWNAIRTENQQTNALVKSEKIELIISDNRYGVYHKKVKSIFISHQLNFQEKPQILNLIANQIQARWINFKYHNCWIPDGIGNDSLAGKLTKQPLLKNAIRIGTLSRFDRICSKELKYKYLVIMSGPEPKRSILENKLKDILPADKSYFVSGKPSRVNSKKGYYNQKELTNLIAHSHYIISRAGYSTIMDLKAMNRSAILIPTPGQSEQEYLAQYLEGHPSFQGVFISEDNLDKILDL